MFWNIYKILAMLGNIFNCSDWRLVKSRFSYFLHIYSQVFGEVCTMHTGFNLTWNFEFLLNWFGKSGTYNLKLKYFIKLVLGEIFYKLAIQRSLIRTTDYSFQLSYIVKTTVKFGKSNFKMSYIAPVRAQLRGDVKRSIID